MGQLSQELEAQEFKQFEVNLVAFIKDVPEKWFLSALNKPLSFPSKGGGEVFDGRCTYHPDSTVGVDTSQSGNPAVWYSEIDRGGLRSPL